jgi:hypothetical protein
MAATGRPPSPTAIAMHGGSTDRGQRDLDRGSQVEEGSFASRSDRREEGGLDT